MIIRRKSQENSYKNGGFYWQGSLPLTELSCTHFVRVSQGIETAKYMMDSDYRESVINESINTSESVSLLLFGVPVEFASGNTALLWGELLKPPPSHRITVGYIVKTGKVERRIIDVNVSFSQISKSDKDISIAIGRYYVQLLQSTTDTRALFRSGRNTEWYLNRLLAKYRSIRGVLG